MLTRAAGWRGRSGIRQRDVRRTGTWSSGSFRSAPPLAFGRRHIPRLC
jgi:hypothetical protein